MSPAHSTIGGAETAAGFHSSPEIERIDQARMPRTVILVLGMHRSGTSALAGMLVRLGAEPPLSLISGDGANEKGYYESAELVRFNDALLAEAGATWRDWQPLAPAWCDGAQAQAFREQGRAALRGEFGQAPLAIVKDPRICRLVPFWRGLLAEEGIAPSVVVPFRAPLDVARSLHSRDTLPLKHGLLLWLRYVLDAEHGSRGLRRCFVAMDDILRDWRGTAVRLSRMLDLPRPAQAAASEIDGFLDARLQHHRASASEIAGLHDWVSDTYRLLGALSETPDAPALQGELDRIRAAFDEACALFDPLIATPDYDGIGWKLTWRWRKLRRLVGRPGLALA